MKNLETNYRKIKLIYLILMISTFFLSCNAQVKTKANPETQNLSKDKPAPQAVYKDGLFFIDGQLCQHLRKIFQDSKGNLWFGTNNYGVMRYNGKSFEYFRKNEGFDNGRITGIVEDIAGNIWFGTYKGLIKYDGNVFTSFTEKDGLLNDEIWSLLIDKKGKFWIGSNLGVSQFDGKQFTTIEISKAKVDDSKTIYSEERITSIVEDIKGNLWFGTDGFGITKYDGQSFTNYTMQDGLCDNTINELMADSKGNIWIGTFWGGVSKFDGKEFKNFTKENAIKGEEVGSFFEDNNGDIWFAAENNGVYVYNGKTFTNLGSNQGLPTNGILSIYRDRENRFWFGGWGGLFRYDSSSFFSVTKDGPWDT